MGCCTSVNQVLTVLSSSHMNSIHIQRPFPDLIYFDLLNHNIVQAVPFTSDGTFSPSIFESKPIFKVQLKSSWLKAAAFSTVFYWHAAHTDCDFFYMYEILKGKTTCYQFISFSVSLQSKGLRGAHSSSFPPHLLSFLLSVLPFSILFWNYHKPSSLPKAGYTKARQAAAWIFNEFQI